MAILSISFKPAVLMGTTHVSSGAPESESSIYYVIYDPPRLTTTLVGTGRGPGGGYCGALPSRCARARDLFHARTVRVAAVAAAHDSNKLSLSLIVMYKC